MTQAYANNNPAKFFDPNGLSPEDDLILSYQQIWQDAEAAFQLNIISIYEKNSVQEFAHSMADELRYQKEHPILTAFNNITEFAVFDILLGDFDGGTVYAADFSQSAMEKMYDNEYNFSAIMATAAIVTYDKGRNLANVKINKQMVRVDIEYPQGGKPGNVHIQNKQTGEKWIIKKLDDIDNLPKSIAKDKTIKKTVSKALKALAKLF